MNQLVISGMQQITLLGTELIYATWFGTALALPSTKQLALHAQISSSFIVKNNLLNQNRFNSR